MLIIECPCSHEWIVSTALGFNWAHALSADPCPACGRDSGGRTANTAPDPSIGDVIGSLAACAFPPCRVLSWSVMEPRNNPKLALVTMQVERGPWRTELIVEVDRDRDAITKAWFARLAPDKISMRRMPVTGIMGHIADLMLSIGMGETSVVDWQAFAEKSTAVFRGKGENADG
jgi:hypothetical protein